MGDADEVAYAEYQARYAVAEASDPRFTPPRVSGAWLELEAELARTEVARVRAQRRRPVEGTTKPLDLGRLMDEADALEDAQVEALQAYFVYDPNAERLRAMGMAEEDQLVW